MMYLVKFVSFLIVVCCVLCSKYDKKFDDENLDKMERPFRINKVNLLWQKARKRLGPKKLDELYVDLKLHDVEEGKLKALKADNGDLDGEKEASVRKAFIDRRNGTSGIPVQNFRSPLQSPRPSGSGMSGTPTHLQQPVTNVSLESIRKHAHQKQTTDKAIADKISSWFTNSRDRKDGEQGGRRAARGVATEVANAAVPGIMEKFHLHDAMDLLEDLEKHKRENEASFIDRPTLKRHKTEFGISMDKKLMTLWEKANMAGFTDDELYTLKREFLHHQEKVDEFNQLKSEVEVMEGISENSIDQFKYSNRSWKDIQKTKEEMKKKHKDLKRSYEDLSYKARPEEIGKLAFSEPRVYELYALAKKANMTAEELDSFKEELQHFEHKIKKHEYMKEQARMNPGQHEKKEKYTGDIDENSAWGKKAVDYGRKIKKIHTELKIRVEKAAARHSEL